VWINRAHEKSCEFPEVASSGKFRIWGSNLVEPGSSGSVLFRDPSTSQLLEGTVIGGDRYSVSVSAPSNLTVGTTYRVTISNGYGGNWGESYEATPLLAIKSGIDHWNLGVSWAADLNFFDNIYNVKSDARLQKHTVGDGNVNDREAIQKAIDKAAADGGGVVYLPPGTYSLRFKEESILRTVGYATEQGLTLRSRVVLQGAGKDQTELRYGFEHSPPGACAVVWADKVNSSGIDSIKIDNSNSVDGWYCNIRDLGSGTELFVHNMSIDLDTQGTGMFWKNVTKLLIENCDVSLGPSASMPYVIESSSWYVVRNNTFKYIRKRIWVTGSQYGVIEANHSMRDFRLPLIKPGDSGGLDLDFVTHLEVLNNTFESIGTVSSVNDGETINSQGCSSPNDDLGNLTGASATLIENAQKHWGSLAGYNLSIVSGAGADQYRAIVMNSLTAATVDRAWSVVPPTGSGYVISRWSAQDLLIKGNVLRNNPKGIWMYCGGADISVIDNTLENSSGIWLRSDQRVDKERFNLLSDVVVDGNNISDKRGVTPAFIAIELQQTQASSLFGTGVYGMEVRNNSIDGNMANPHDGVLANGLWSWVKYQHDGLAEPSSDTYQPGIVGTVFQNNKITGTEHPYTTSTGDYGTIILDPSNDLGSVRNEIGRGARVGAAESFVGH
jgi:hypothetical protein